MNSESIKAKIRNLANKKNIDSQILLRSYLLERILERISHSKYKDNFVLKGGLLICSLVGVDLRSTLDLDATIKNIPLTKESIEKIFREIIDIDVGDIIKMSITKIQDIRDEDEYSGVRLSLVAKMDKAKIPLKVDISTGDKITPKEISYTYKLLLEDRSISIGAYPIETVLAEKIESILSRNLLNTRMRDFYDIYILLKTKKTIVDVEILKKAFINTSKKRKTYIDITIDVTSILEKIFKDDDLKDLWERYQIKYPYAKDIEWEQDIKISCLEIINILNL